MVKWMDSVDQSLKNIMREVNTLEEFEREKAIFQVIVLRFRSSHIKYVQINIKIMLYYRAFVMMLMQNGKT
jgi:hypothetical protein